MIGASAGTLSSYLAELLGTSRRNRPPGVSRSAAGFTIHDGGAFTVIDVTDTFDFCARKTRTLTATRPPGTTVSASASGSTTMPAARIIASVKSRSFAERRNSASARAGAGAFNDDSDCRAARTALMPSISGARVRDGSRGS